MAGFKNIRKPLMQKLIPLVGLSLVRGVKKDFDVVGVRLEGPAHSGISFAARVSQQACGHQQLEVVIHQRRTDAELLGKLLGVTSASRSHGLNKPQSK